MPAFQNLISGVPQKRKSDVDEVSRKRIAVDNELASSGVGRGNQRVRYWMVQW